MPLLIVTFYNNITTINIQSHTHIPEQIWSPHHAKDINILISLKESKKFLLLKTYLIYERNTLYKERLKILSLPFMETRRVYNELILLDKTA